MSTTANITVYKNGVTLTPVVHRVRLVTGGAAAHNASASAHAGLFDPAGSALTAQAAAIAAAHALVDDLSGVNDVATARSNLGLGSAAVEDTSAFDPAGSAATAEAAAKSYADGLAGNYDAAGSAATVASDLADHEADTANPHSVTAVQAGADPAGSAATAQAAAVAAAAALVDDLSGVSNAATARSNLGLGTIATEAAADYAELAGATFSGDVEIAGNASIGGTYFVVDDSASEPVAFGARRMLFGAGSGDNLSDGVNKNMYIAMRHYSNDTEAPFLGFICTTTSSSNIVNFGGGSGLYNAAKSMGFYAAPDNTTRTGTRQMLIDEGGVTVHAELAAEGDVDLADGAIVADFATKEVEIAGIVDFTGTMGSSAKDPTADAPDAWLELKIDGTIFYFPGYAAS